jgi:glucokinase
MILAGDIGGTHTRLALFDADPHVPVAFETYASGEHAGLGEMVQAFLADRAAPIGGAAFAVAGPVSGGRAKTTNLPWPVDAAQLAAVLGLPSVALVNDLYANAYGIAELGPEDLVTLNAGDPSVGGNAAVISAGTGLGEAGLYWDGERYHAFASEGGHCDFAPRTELEIELLRFLAGDGAHVSYEHVCSGIGLVNVYRFLRARSGTTEPSWLTEALARGEGAAAIGAAAIACRDEVCQQALALMVSIYGAEAGNLALKLLATGGVYLGGGIAPRILPQLREGSFLAAFTDKGRFAALLERIPVRVIVNDRTALFGAARYARQQRPSVPSR